MYFALFLDANVDNLSWYAKGSLRGVLQLKPRAREELLNYLAALLLSWFIGVSVYFVRFFQCKMAHLQTETPGREKARILDHMPRARKRITYLLTCFAIELVDGCIGVFCRFLHWYTGVLV